jgi:hypothetical protein
MRHTAITRLLENPEASEKTVEAIAGHISQKMKDRYAHIRMEARRAAVVNLLNASVGTPVHAAGEKPLTNRDVLDMLAADFEAAVVVGKIRASKCAFDTSLETLRQLKASGVPQSVIVAMLQPQERAGRTKKI